MNRSPIYSHPKIYELVMRGLYGKQFQNRYKSILCHIPPNCESIVEICCGDAYLYRHYLKCMVKDYYGYDINERFIRIAQRRGIKAEVMDIRVGKPRTSQVVLMQASLYQFIPKHHDVIEKMLEVASDIVIIAEPVRNVASSKNYFISRISGFMSNPGSGSVRDRFSKDSFIDAMHMYKSNLRYCDTISGGREMIAVLDVNT